MSSPILSFFLEQPAEGTFHRTLCGWVAADIDGRRDLLLGWLRAEWLKCARVGARGTDDPSVRYDAVAAAALVAAREAIGVADKRWHQLVIDVPRLPPATRTLLTHDCEDPESEPARGLLTLRELALRRDALRAWALEKLLGYS